MQITAHGTNRQRITFEKHGRCVTIERVGTDPALSKKESQVNELSLMLGGADPNKVHVEFIANGKCVHQTSWYNTGSFWQKLQRKKCIDGIKNFLKINKLSELNR